MAAQHGVGDEERVCLAQELGHSCGSIAVGARPRRDLPHRISNSRIIWEEQIRRVEVDPMLNLIILLSQLALHGRYTFHISSSSRLCDPAPIAPADVEGVIAQRRGKERVCVQQ